MKLARIYNLLLKSTMLFCGLCLLISCSSEEEIQPAQLIKASSSDAESDSLEVDPLPLNGRGIISVSSIIELVFDKPVLEVSINYSTKGTPNGVLPATVWKLEGNQLDVWDYLEVGFNPERDVTLTIIYEDETGIHKDTLDVTLGGYHIDVFPPVIDSSTVRHNQIDADANQLNRDGIRITFSDWMNPRRTEIEIYSGQVILNWKLYWTDRTKTVILLPESEFDWLLPAHEYEIHLVDFYDYRGTRGRGLEEKPLVIRFETAN